ncbi:hypothetical protein RRG08_057944 [Elysia crispata]|uniref:Uncharacterized protein n=1 Tax=Elysia crispata TaxID=231223 RepID=A0AAE0YCX4_9GAST|nr:hypothetical protein RRG08_057944 [Elysia crispata]
MTPLLLAARAWLPEVIKLLKECGANMNAVDNGGKNAVFQTFERIYGDGHHETLQLVASDKDQVNMQMPDGVTPLILAAKEEDNKAIEILLEAGADPHKKNNNQETALSILLGSYSPRHEAMVGLKMLIRHGALLSLPKYDCLKLYRMIVSDERELVQLMVTMAWPQYEYMSQPMSLVQLSFVAVSAQLGETIGREERVRKTPLPTILQDRLLFKKEMSSMESTDEEENCMNHNFLVYEQLAALTLFLK